MKKVVAQNEEEKFITVEEEGYDVIDFKESIEDVLASVDFQLAGFGLEVEILENGSDEVIYKIVRK